MTLTAKGDVIRTLHDEETRYGFVISTRKKLFVPTVGSGCVKGAETVAGSSVRMLQPGESVRQQSRAAILANQGRAWYTAAMAEPDDSHFP